jgi:hypothetical protein
MSAGFHLTEQVAALLSETARPASEIVAAIGNRSPRAIRYALHALVKAGRAWRYGKIYFACPDIMVDVVDVTSGNMVSSGVPLRSCFREDFVAYGIARDTLTNNMMPTIGGGAEPLLEIRRIAQAEAE